LNNNKITMILNRIAKIKAIWYEWKRRVAYFTKNRQL